MIKLPMSDFLQKYYQENGITFTDSEKHLFCGIPYSLCLKPRY